jgi:hypothetical protein
MATTLFLAPAGCSIGGGEEPQPASGAPREIGEVVHELERATARRDVDGERATVRVRTDARGQATVAAILELRRRQGEWRIDSLGWG